MHQQLLDFIAHARKKGMDHGTIRLVLLSAGWREKDVAHGLVEEGLDLAVPEPPSGGGAREAFLYLLMFIALYHAVISLILLFCQAIDYAFPDPTEAAQSYVVDYALSRIRWSLATLIVSTPLFLFLKFQLDREIRRHPERARSAIRRWLGYLTLLVASITVMVDLILLLAGFLEGDLSTRFLLKVLVVLVVTGCVIVYYLLTLRRHEEASA